MPSTPRIASTVANGNGDRCGAVAGAALLGAGAGTAVGSGAGAAGGVATGRRASSRVRSASERPRSHDRVRAQAARLLEPARRALGPRAVQPVDRSRVVAEAAQAALHLAHAARAPGAGVAGAARDRSCRPVGAGGVPAVAPRARPLPGVGRGHRRESEEREDHAGECRRPSSHEVLPSSAAAARPGVWTGRGVPARPGQPGRSSGATSIGGRQRGRDALRRRVRRGTAKAKRRARSAAPAAPVAAPAAAEAMPVAGLGDCGRGAWSPVVRRSGAGCAARGASVGGVAAGGAVGGREGEGAVQRFRARARAMRERAALGGGWRGVGRLGVAGGVDGLGDRPGRLGDRLRGGAGRPARPPSRPAPPSWPRPGRPDRRPWRPARRLV